MIQLFLYLGLNNISSLHTSRKRLLPWDICMGAEVHFCASAFYPIQCSVFPCLQSELVAVSSVITSRQTLPLITSPCPTVDMVSTLFRDFSHFLRQQPLYFDDNELSISSISPFIGYCLVFSGIQFCLNW